MYNTFIFDLDGTLLNTLGDLATSVNYALRTHGMPERTLDEVRSFVGNGVRLLMERAVPEGTAHPCFEEAFATFRQYYMEHSHDTTRPYEGIPEVIHALKERGCRLAVVSNKFYAATQELIRHFFPEITIAIGEHEAEGIRKKPAPDTVFEALRQLANSQYLTAKEQMPSMSVTVMSTCRRRAIADCRVSVSSGASATVTSSLPMEPPPLSPVLSNSWISWKNLSKVPQIICLFILFFVHLQAEITIKK